MLTRIHPARKVETLTSTTVCVCGGEGVLQVSGQVESLSPSQGWRVLMFSQMTSHIHAVTRTRAPIQLCSVAPGRRHHNHETCNKQEQQHCALAARGTCCNTSLHTTSPVRTMDNNMDNLLVRTHNSTLQKINQHPAEQTNPAPCASHHYTPAVAAVAPAAAASALHTGLCCCHATL
jgi:hypothetical protein